MSLTPVTIGDNPFLPQVSAETYVSDQLIAGNLKLITTNVTFATGAAVVYRGTVMGIVTATGKVIPSVETAADGSQVPVGIAVDTYDVTTGDAAGAVYQMGEFNFSKVLYDVSWGASYAVAKAALRGAFGARPVYLNDVTTATDPT